MFPLLLEACPSFRPKWEEFLEKWAEYDDDLPLYLAIADLARHLIDMLARGQTSHFPNIFAPVERWHLEGDDYVQTAATIGLIEDLQNSGLHKSTDREQFRPYLLPISETQWDRLYDFWGDRPEPTQ